ncbi:MAG: acyl-CoA synthetase [Spongiibacteraceae bacterium]|nr:acyl-CoA synthetase [Spongiibacteraceae bacterium]
MNNLGFWHFAHNNPAATALIAPEATAPRRVSRGELLAESNRLSHALRDLGLTSGDAVAIAAPNSVESFELYLATIQIGLYLVPVNWHLAAPEIEYILRDSGARVFIAHEKLKTTAINATTDSANAGRQCHCFAIGDIPGFGSYHRLKSGQPATAPPERRAGQVMNYTSGTTGRPKAVKRALPDLSPDLLYSIMPSMLGNTFNIGPEDGHVHYCGSPLYHTAVTSWAGNSLHLGHCVVVVDKWDAAQMLADIERFAVTTSHMVPTQFTRLLKLPDTRRRQHKLGSLRSIIHAAAPCPPAVKQAMLDWWGPIIYEYYAGTEGGSAICTPQDWLKYPGTVGKAPPSSGLRILDDEGADLPPNSPGSVYLKIMDGMDFEYKGDAEKTRANRKGDYFTLGDIGYLNEEGFLFLSDRKIDMIISGGANIYPAEVENVLIMHPAVLDCAVFGIPNDDWGEEVKAVVQLCADATADDALQAELQHFLQERLAKMKLPRSYDFVTELPRDPNGKLYKRRLRDAYWQGRERAV